jgi:hypothetical protein
LKLEVKQYLRNGLWKCVDSLFIVVRAEGFVYVSVAVCCNVTLCRVRVAFVAVETQQCILCVADLHVTVGIIKIQTFEQQCFYGKFMSPATIQHT